MINNSFAIFQSSNIDIWLPRITTEIESFLKINLLEDVRAKPAECRKFAALKTVIYDNTALIQQELSTSILEFCGKLALGNCW